MLTRNIHYASFRAMTYKTETIKNVVMNIRDNKYLLPAFQRELVWDYEQIEKLFDSVLSGYPFGSMLFWRYKKDQNNKDYKFYEFLKIYDEYNCQNNHNIEHEITGKDEITGILDGQQRLTALFLGLKGFLNLHKPRTRWDNSDNFEKKYLFINLLYSKDNETEYEDIRPEFQIRFKSDNQVEKENSSQDVYWFKMGSALDWKEKKSWKEVLDGKNISEKQRDTIEDVCSAIYENLINPNNPRISYYEENTDSLDKVLNIFVRINAGGTPLDYTDFLMSMIINQWGEGRENINMAIDNISKDFEFDIPKDVFLRACLFLTGENLNFKADNFKQKTIKNIKNEFEAISESLRKSCRVFRELGYSKNNLRSNLILLPLAYFIKTNNFNKVSDDDFVKIKKWIQLSILGRVFGSQTTSYLTKLRKDIVWERDFPLNEIIKVSNEANKNMDINEDRLDDIIKKAKKGSQDSWALLTLLYPSHNYRDVNFHEDHIYPYSKLNNEHKRNNGDFISNIQLLEGGDNCSKNDREPKFWMEEYCSKRSLDLNDYKNKNFIPLSVDLTFDNFSHFISARKELIKTKLLENLKN